jgi:IS605 OrfB family transposase
VKQTIVLKLETSTEQHQALLATVEAFNHACQFVADVAYQKRLANKIAIQPMVYNALREQFGLSSQMAVRAISKAIEAYKRDKRVHVRFDSHGAMIFDERIMSFKGVTHVSLLALSGRLLIPLRFGAYQASRLDRRKGQADLVLRNGVFYLYVCIDLPEPPPADTSGGVLGVDLGIVEIATDSEGNSYSGSQVKQVRRNLRNARQSLQRRQTNSAKKRLRKLSGRQARFVRNVNHVVSKAIVQTASASQKAIAIESLTGIRERASVFGKEMRWLLGNWSFHQLQQFVCYKAQALGIPVIEVNPRNTSRTCSQCGYCAKANRKSQAHFDCQQCGYQTNADVNASCNIARLGREAQAARSCSPMSSVAITG